MKWLIGIIIVLLLIIVGMIVNWPKVVEISDEQPKSNLLKDGWLKLQNEGVEYLKYEDGKVKLKVVK